MSHATATKTAAKKPAKKKVSAFSTRKVDPAYYWMVVPAAIIFAFFLYLPFLDGVKYGSVKPTLTYERGALIREEVQTFSLWPLLLNGYRYSKARGVHVQHQCSGCGS